jgi:hypothetical protein
MSQAHIRCLGPDDLEPFSAMRLRCMHDAAAQPRKSPADVRAEGVEYWR